eukprot:XP_017448531.1 PREDICTED: uncharacterized protein LOC103692234 isoform X1 [Rattus norvegicus]
MPELSGSDLLSLNASRCPCRYAVVIPQVIPLAPGPTASSTEVHALGRSISKTEFARYENGHYLYRIHRSPLCEYMINFIHKLKHLPEKYMMNFTILQVRHAADAHKGVHQWVVPMASLSRVLTFTFSTAGCHQPRHTGDLAVYCICLRSFSQ